MVKFFDFVVSNPPYQIVTSEDSNKMVPIYSDFFDLATSLSDNVSVICPGRWLFNAGATPKQWNNKMLSDPHVFVSAYYSNSKDVFPSVDIKGGVVIVSSSPKNTTPIGTFIQFDELRKLLENVKSFGNFVSFSDLFSRRSEFSVLLDGVAEDLGTNIFAKFPELFKISPVSSTDVKVLGLINLQRVERFMNSEILLNSGDNLDKFKVVVPAANGSGAFGRVVGPPVVLGPQEIYTRTFLGLEGFDSLVEAENCAKYIKTKFLRALVSILKPTQHNNREVWRYVPVQDFTVDSDIDWSLSIDEIDKQLFAKYSVPSDVVEFVIRLVKAAE